LHLAPPTLLSGSFDLIGNPVDLAYQILDGARDFVVEPFVGLQQSPLGFGLGLVRGSLSLVRKCAVGVCGAANKVTASLGRTVALLSVDDEFLARYGTERDLKTSAKKVFTGIARGIAGVFIDPFVAVQRRGCSNFFRGFAKGLAGLVAKPTAATLNFVSRLFLVVKDTLSLSTQLEAVRPRRFIQDGVLEVFDFRRGATFAVYALLCARKVIAPPAAWQPASSSASSSAGRARGGQLDAASAATRRRAAATAASTSTSTTSAITTAGVGAAERLVLFVPLSGANILFLTDTRLAFVSVGATDLRLSGLGALVSDADDDASDDVASGGGGGSGSGGSYCFSSSASSKLRFCLPRASILSVAASSHRTLRITYGASSSMASPVAASANEHYDLSCDECDARSAAQKLRQIIFGC
jgi:hypothetical protein